MNVKNNSNNISKSKNNLWVYYLVIALLGFILYGQSIGNDFNIDDDYVYENHELVQKGISGIPEIFKSRYNTKDEQYFGYRPLTIAIYAIEYEVFKSNPNTAHFFNILYYIISCFLLFYLLINLFKTKFKDGYLWIAFISVLIFQSLAVHSEVVLSLKNREEMVSLIFSLLSFLFASKFFDQRKVYQIIASVVFIGLAFLAKESAIVFVILIPFTIVFFKTNIKILSQLEMPKKVNWKNEIFLLKLLLVTLIITFIMLTGNFRIINNLQIKLNSYDSPISEYFIWILFIIVYTYILIKNSRNKKNVLTKTNITIWSIALILTIFIPILSSHLSAVLVLLVLLSSFIKTKSGNNTQVHWVENVTKKAFVRILSFIIIAGIALALTYYIPKQSLPESNAPVYKWQNPSFTTNKTSDKAAVAIYSLGYYSKLLLVPYPLRFYYGYKMVPDAKMSDILVIISLAFHLFLLIVALRGFNKRSLLSFGILFYLMAIFPFANTFFPLTGVIAERLLFVPSIGFSIIAVYFILKILKRDDILISNKALRNKSLFLAGLLIFPNAIISINRNSDWKNRETLFTHDIEYLENSAKANNLYGDLLLDIVKEKQRIEKRSKPTLDELKKIELAYKHSQRAVEIDSTYSNPWNTLGYINTWAYKNYKSAAEQFSMCIKIDSTVAGAYFNRGIAYFEIAKSKSGAEADEYVNKSLSDFKSYLNKTGKLSEQKQIQFTIYFNLFEEYLISNNKYNLLLKVVELEDLVNPDLKTNELKKGVFLLLSGNKEEGEKILNNILNSESNNELNYEQVHSNLLNTINTLVKLKKYNIAMYISDFEIAKFPEVDAPYVDKGNYYLLTGDTVQAIQNWEVAFEKFNGNYNIGMTLYQYFSSKGNIEKANYYYNKAVLYRQNNPVQ